MNLVGNVCLLEIVVMKHMRVIMVLYTGLKIGKIMKKKLDAYGLLFVYLVIRNERKIVN